MTRPAMKMVARFAALAIAVTLGCLPAAQARMRGSFDDADANHDGRVTLQEFVAYASQRLATANGPGAQRFHQLSAQQQSALLQRRFDRTDNGHKGYLDRNDWNSP